MGDLIYVDFRKEKEPLSADARIFVWVVCKLISFALWCSNKYDKFKEWENEKAS